MISDNIANIKAYASLSPLMAEGLKIAEKLWAEQPEPGEKTVIIAGKLWYTVFDIKKSAPAESVFEAHRKYADIHLVLSGSEKVMINCPQALIPTEDFDTAADAGFYKGEPAVVAVLKPGDFYIALPQDAHAPNLETAADEGLRKAVIKVLWN